jgi:hypothetical protein
MKDQDTDITLAREALDKGGTQFFVMGGIGIACLVGSLSPLTGVLIAVWVVIRGWQQSTAHGNSAVAILSGEYLHALDGEAFREQSRAIGYLATKAEIERAIAQKLPLSKAAWEFSRSIEAPPMVRVFSSEITPPPPTLPSSSPQPLPLPSEEEDEDEEILGEMSSKNLFILGLGGSGKGIVVSNLIRHLPPDVVVTVIDPKGEERERGYWDGVNYLGFKSMNLTPSEVVEKLDNCLNNYHQTTTQAEMEGKRSLLIIDEMAALGHACKQCKYTRVGDIIVSITSLGDCLGRKIWLIGQSPYVSSMGFNLSQLSQLEWIVLLREGQNINQWKSVNMPPIDTNKLNNLISSSPVKRAIAIKGKWLPMPVLPNYSNIDRDKNTTRSDVADEVYQNIKDEPLIQKWREQIRLVGKEAFLKSLSPQSRVKVQKYLLDFLE